MKKTLVARCVARDNISFISNLKYDAPIANDPASNGNTASFVRNVDRRPYFPLWTVDPADEAMVPAVAKVMVASSHKNTTGGEHHLSRDTSAGTVTVITAGLTKALFKVELPIADTGASSPPPHLWRLPPLPASS